MKIPYLLQSLYLSLVAIWPSASVATTAPSPAIQSIDAVYIIASGDNTAGKNYSLECIVTVTGSTNQPTITWMVNDALINSTTTRMVSEITGSDGSYSTTLIFNPLAASHAGTYACRATLENTVELNLTDITVTSEFHSIQEAYNCYKFDKSSSCLPDPTIIISINAGASTGALIFGSMYSLTCNVSGAERLTDAMVTYQWFRNGVVVSGQTMANLSFSSLTFSNAGRYICEATVTSSLLSAPITNTSTMPNPVIITRKPLVSVLYNKCNLMLASSWCIHLLSQRSCIPQWFHSADN